MLARRSYVNHFWHRLKTQVVAVIQSHHCVIRHMYRRDKFNMAPNARSSILFRGLEEVSPLLVELQTASSS
jgi:uncharacterized membrane protein